MKNPITKTAVKAAARKNNEIKDVVTLNKLIKVLQKIKTKMRNGKYEVEFWLGEDRIELDSIGHFNVVPNTTFTFSKLDKE